MNVIVLKHTSDEITKAFELFLGTGVLDYQRYSDFKSDFIITDSFNLTDGFVKFRKISSL